MKHEDKSIKGAHKLCIPPHDEDSEAIAILILFLFGLCGVAFFLKVADQGWPSWLSWIWGG